VRLLVLSGLVLWAGTTLVLADLRPARRDLLERLRPFSPGAPVAVEHDLFAPVARLLGLREELAVRLQRVHSPQDVAEFRLRQLGLATIAMIAAALVVGVAGPPVPLGVVGLIGAPLLAFLVVEQQASTRSARWQARMILELPVVSEQLAMLVSAGYSLGTALARLAERGHGVCATDLRRVCDRIRQGLNAAEALREWASVAGVGALDHLVGVLALHHDATDLGRLISDEARAIRRDVQRKVVETMEHRAQTVWIPVTVATLVPGVILLAIPFTRALQLFTNG
jgi:tight adherence protein C